MRIFYNRLIIIINLFITTASYWSCWSCRRCWLFLFDDLGVERPSPGGV